MKITDEKRVGMRSLVRNILEVKGMCWNPRIRIRKNDKQVNYSHKANKPNNKLVNA
jgi:hypothetical protein